MTLTETSSDPVSERMDQVRARIAAAALRGGRSGDDVTLVAVSKTHPPEMLREAIAAGISDLGENKIQEAEEKIPEVGRRAVRWHLIGHLQSNKARKAVVLFDLIHSLDSAALAARLDRMCDQENREELPVLIQVDLGHEQTKSGVAEGELRALVNAISKCQHLRLQGLMTLPPFFDDAEDVRPFFRKLRDLRDKLRLQGAFGDDGGELSMGMTHDFEV